MGYFNCQVDPSPGLLRLNAEISLIIKKHIYLR